ncbi:MAG: HupE/UreJ family protein [Rhodocyclaceae bacterium]|nr:HupE/UreJ family protein [Rhodocyclaceae bacterium]
MTACRTAILLLVLGCLLPLTGWAHQLERSHIFLSFSEHAIAGRIEINMSDLNRVFGLDLRTDHQVTRADVEPHAERIYAYLRQRAHFAPDGTAREMRIRGFHLVDVRIAQYVSVDFDLGEFAQMPERLDVEYRAAFDVLPEHRGLLVVENNWKSSTFNNERVVSLIFGPDDTSQQLDLSSSTTVDGFVGMVELGVHHIWDGIDHLLFLFALLLPSVVRRGRDGWRAAPDFRGSLIHVIKIVTVFTIAHTITLSMAALGTLDLSPRIVESVIALSIAIAALDVLFPIFRSRIWLIVFAFGLFHGFGFASVLGSIGIPPEYLVHSLLAFNIGVEVGQIAVVAAIFPILYLSRSAWFYPRLVLRLGPAGLIAIASYWFVERAFEVDLPAGEWMNRVLAAIS